MHLLQIPTEDENLRVNNRQHDEIFLEERKCELISSRIKRWCSFRDCFFGLYIRKTGRNTGENVTEISRDNRSFAADLPFQGRLPRPGLVFSIVASVFLIFDLSMERESATFAMTDKSPSASSSAVVASSIVYLLGAFASVFSFQDVRCLVCPARNRLQLAPSDCHGTLRLRGIVIQSAPCATDSVRPSGLGRSLDHGEEHSRVMLFGVKSNKSPNSGQMLIFIVLLEHLLVWCCAVHYQTVLFFRGAEERPQTIHRCWCRVRNGQNPTAMMMQPPNLTVDSADLVLAAFRAMLLFAARAHAVRTDFICSL
ncbi:hypothetical protein T09_14748 [Trichinella sp. T9]|nr:hypothetical protein T09_14748 [Trichinella sp. T9]